MDRTEADERALENLKTELDGIASSFRKMFADVLPSISDHSLRAKIVDWIAASDHEGGK